MNENQLRLGNYVKTSLSVASAIALPDGEIIRAAGVCENLIMANIDNNGEWITAYLLPSDIQPIPLSEEMLAKCGFIKDPATKYVYDHESGVVFDAPNDWDNTSDYPVGIDVSQVSPFGYGGSGDIIIRSLYLHDLQNKFFTITGKELEIKF